MVKKDVNDGPPALVVGLTHSLSVRFSLLDQHYEVSTGKDGQTTRVGLIVAFAPGSWIPVFVPSRMGFHATGASCFLKADLFYLEVVLLPCGEVEDVKMALHRGSPVVCKRIICAMK